MKEFLILKFKLSLTLFVARSDTTEDAKKKLCSSLYDHVKGRISPVMMTVMVNPTRFALRNLKII